MRWTDYSKIEQIDKDRRRYSHHFHKIRLLLDSGVVSESFVKKVVSSGQVNFLLEVIEPLEEALNPNYNHSTFDTFRRIYQKDDIRGGKTNESPRRLTADKKEIKDFPKLPSATSFIRKTLYAIGLRQTDSKWEKNYESGRK